MINANSVYTTSNYGFNILNTYNATKKRDERTTKSNSRKTKREQHRCDVFDNAVPFLTNW